MREIEHPKGKIYYSMGEVSEMFDVRPSLLRYWEQEFDIIKPHRNKKGNRLYTPKDVDNIRMIYHLVKEKNMKLEAARKHLKNNKDEATRDAEIVERLMGIRAMLMQIKQDLLYGSSEDDDYEIQEEPEATLSESPVGPGIIPADIAAMVAAAAASDEVLTVSDVMREEEMSSEKPPFEEQTLFEVVPEPEPDINTMINTFIAKNYDEEADEEHPEVDPFAGIEDRVEESPEKQEPEEVRPMAIDQTLF